MAVLNPGQPFLMAVTHEFDQSCLCQIALQAEAADALPDLVGLLFSAWSSPWAVRCGRGVTSLRRGGRHVGSVAGWIIGGYRHTQHFRHMLGANSPNAGSGLASP
jgi:hypothetical protein